MITKSHYFGLKPCPKEHDANADKLLEQVNALLHYAADAGVYDYWIDPDTNSQISGSKGGAGDGGYRLPDSKTGAAGSSHRVARGIDIYDPENKLDAWVTRSILIKYNLYREHPDSTPGWLHLTDRAPGSGCRTFKP